MLGNDWHNYLNSATILYVSIILRYRLPATSVHWPPVDRRDRALTLIRGKSGEQKKRR
jgi:hypothetical protein